LSNKVRIAVHSKKLGKFSPKHVRFYMKYASFVFRALRRPSFQSFLHWMLRKENIEAHMVMDVQVRVFPFQSENGNGLAGNCNVNRGEIQIYPKRLAFCRKLMQKFGRKKLISYVKGRARAALIHELLHLKYSNDEEKVRKLTKKYFAVFTQNRLPKSSDILSISNIIFRPKVTKNAPKHIDQDAGT